MPLPTLRRQPRTTKFDEPLEKKGKPAAEQNPRKLGNLAIRRRREKRKPRKSNSLSNIHPKAAKVSRK